MSMRFAVIAIGVVMILLGFITALGGAYYRPSLIMKVLRVLFFMGLFIYYAKEFYDEVLSIWSTINDQTTAEQHPDNIEL